MPAFAMNSFMRSTFFLITGSFAYLETSFGSLGDADLDAIVVFMITNLLFAEH